jgi:homogentisate phytyltransferase/homogentisate geranylgeranyltransferase
MMGTTISVTSVSLLALQGQAVTQQAVLAIAQALTAALLANSIVGLNQVFDVDIDRVNKPYLPLASGDFTLNTGIAIVLVTAVGAMLSSVCWGSPALAWTVGISLVLGVLYSTELPFMRWKRFPFLAASCILAVRAIIVQLGFYLHIKQVLATAQIPLTRPLAFTIAFMLLFSIVIALFKDIPDVKGDDQAGVRTASVRLGVPRVFWTCISLLMVAYTGGVVFGLTSGSWGSAAVTCAGHAAAAALLWSRSKLVNLGKKGELVEHYMFIWKLFYAEYLFIPFLR